jgi:ABC-type phosphate/phosphonate transport system substrate-binding protein/rhodanese-related sulfurtransferase
MSKTIAAFLLLFNAVAWPLHASADSLLLSVNTDSAEEISRLDSQEAYQAFANYLSASIGAPVKLVVGQNATTALQRTRTGYYAILLGPAHVIGSALKYGYEPVAKYPGSYKTVFVAMKASNIHSLEQAKGKRLGLPSADSLPTYLAKGEMNAAGIQLKSYFKNVTYSRYQDSALFALGINQQDVVAVDEGIAKKWLAQNPGVIVQETQAVPNLSVAVNGKTIPKPMQDKIRAALLQLSSSPQASLLHRIHATNFEAATRDDFQYVSTLGYFTPKVLPGASVITADEAKALMDKGTPLYDTRVAHEYTESHIKGAISVPYKENSAKEVDFDDTLDAFDLSKLPKDKSAGVIFACNGAECWKSYKSAKQAIKNHYTKVYWYRGGYPEWKGRGYAVE